MTGADHLTHPADLIIEFSELSSCSLVTSGMAKVSRAKAAVNDSASVQIRRYKGRLRPNLLLPLPSLPIVLRRRCCFEKRFSIITSHVLDDLSSNFHSLFFSNGALDKKVLLF